MIAAEDREAYGKWVQECICATAAHRYGWPWLIDRAVPLRLRFTVASVLVCPPLYGD
jgi:hypothetical protein